MSVPPPRPDAGGTSDRVRCAYCGANNFPTSPTCWQCARPLRPLSVGAQSAPSVGTAPSGAVAPSVGPAPAWDAGGAIPGVSPGLAPKAAAALGLLFPWAGLPLGLVFLMLDDPRKARLGWIAIGWSIGGTVLNLLLLLPLFFALGPLFHPHAGIPGGGLPGMPSVPSADGGDLNMAFPRLFCL